ncbi:putative Heterokaryon incompatibility protein, partial [Fusarium austroafricanum]
MGNDQDAASGTEPKSRLEAKEHILRIRSDKKDGPQSIIQDLEAALSVLSKDLNTKSTHFLLEMLQNADDCRYKSNKGEMHISYQNGHLQLDYNELGFTPNDINALCRVARSSKVGSADQCTGEKGIGFKSVFRVADVVTISSGYYSFQFRKKERLGMITPIWIEEQDFPGTPRSGWTSIAMEILDPYRQEIVQEIKHFDSTWLAFLRRLRSVNINVEIDGHPAWKTTHLRQDGSAPPQIKNPGSFHKFMALTHDKTSKTYAMTNFKVHMTTEEEKRPGVKQVDLQLAFPTLSDLTEPALTRSRSEQVFAYLPIRDSGCKVHSELQFLIQSDFLLVANREDIADSCLWNEAILAAFPRAFCSSISTFIDTPLRYTWPRYLESSGTGRLASAFEQIKSSLKWEMPVFETEGGTLEEAWKLRFIPETYRLTSGEPITLCSQTSYKYLSSRYSMDDREYMKGLVRDTTSSEFLKDLKTFMDNHQSTGFREKDENWYGQLAEMLIPMLSSHRTSEEARTIKSLAMIPLRDNRWCRASDLVNGTCFMFPSKDPSMKIPAGISILEIHPGVQSDKHRLLLTSLGVKEFSVTEIQNAIVNYHKSVWVSVETLLSQANFLYDTGWTNQHRVDLWVVTEYSKTRRASSTYMDAAGQFTASSLFAGYRDRFPFISSDYIMGLDGDHKSAKVAWLQEQLALPTTPQLVSFLGPNDGYVLSPEFEYILKSFPSEVLLLLRHNWHLYRGWVEPVEKGQVDPFKESREAIRTRLGSIPVACRDERDRQLNETFLPPERLSSKLLASLPVISLPGGDYASWVFLRHLGVVIDDHVKIYFKCLHNISGKSASLEDAASLYNAIYHRRSGNEKLIKDEFTCKGKALIFIPSSELEVSSGSWVEAENCVWTGPNCLQHIKRLALVYPSLRPLFVEVIGMKKADLSTFVAEARSISPSRPLYDIIGLFREISIELKKPRNKEGGEELLRNVVSCKIFPLHEGNDVFTEGPSYYSRVIEPNLDHLSTALGDSEWYIADRAHLEKSFHGKVPLLAVSCYRIHEFMPMIQALKLEGRLLSRIAKDKVLKKGEAKEHFAYTNSMRTRSDLILRIMCYHDRNLVGKRLARMRQHLRQTCVYTVDAITVRWSIKSLLSDSSDVIYGHDDDGCDTVVMNPSSQDGMVIYMNSKAIFPTPTMISRLQTTLNLPSRDLLYLVLAGGSIEGIQAQLDREGIPLLELKQDEDQNATSKDEGLGNLSSKGPVVIPEQDSRTSTSPGTVLRPNGPVHNIQHILWPESGKSSDRKVVDMDREDADRDLHPGLRRPESGLADYEPLSQFSGIQPSGASHFQIRKAAKERPYEGYEAISETAPGRSVLVATARTRVKKSAGPQSAPIPQIVGPLTMIFMPSAGSLPAVNLSNANRKILPSRLELSKSSLIGREGAECTLFAAVELEPASDQNVGFIAELLVSRILSRHLGDHYHPDTHWTSKLRELDDRKTFHSGDEPMATFTFTNCPRLTELLINLAYKPAETWKLSGHTPSYHVEVQPTLGDITFLSLPIALLPLFDKPFGLDKDLVFCFNPDSPPHVVILVRVFDLATNPRASFYIDPWGLLSDGKISPKVQDDYMISTEPGSLDATFSSLKWLGDRQSLERRLTDLKQLEVAAKEALMPAPLEPIQLMPGTLIPTPPMSPSREEVKSTKTAKRRGARPTVRGFVATLFGRIFRPQSENVSDHESYPTLSSSRSSSFSSSVNVFTTPRHQNVAGEQKGLQHNRWDSPSRTDREGLINLQSTTSESEGNDVLTVSKVWENVASGQPPTEAQLSHAMDVVDDYRIYGYRKLETKTRTIRLLELYAGADGSKLRGTLRHCSLDASPTFCAISYVWGFDLKLYSIELDADDSPAVRDLEVSLGNNKEVIRVTPSLYSALRRVRDKGKSVTVWADAICINQDDNEEKVRQILLMPEIFKAAQTVFAWLGEESDRSAEAIRKLADIAKASKRSRNLQSRGVPTHDDLHWNYINKLLSRPWFRRVWIVQELVFAQKAIFLCGKTSSMTWDDLSTAADICVQEAQKATTGLMKETVQNAHALLSLRDLRDKWHGIHEEHGKGLPLLWLFESFQHTQSTKRRDKLFGFLGLANDSDAIELRPNYDDTLETIVLRYASVFVKRRSTLELLYRAGGPSSNRFPSWIPDWTTTAGGKTISNWPSGEGFNACIRPGGQTCSLLPYQPHHDNRALIVPGHIIDKIETRGKTEAQSSDAILYLKEVFETVNSLSKYPGRKPQSLGEVGWRLAIGDASRTLTGSSVDVDFAASHDALMRYLALEAHPGDWRAELRRMRAAADIKQALFEPDELRRKLWPYLDTALEFADRFSRPVVCVTQAGYVGLIPGAAKEGDMVVLVEGSKVPFVIRRVEGVTNECYQLV